MLVLGYDERVKKLLLSLLLLFLFSAGMLTPKQVLAACSDPNNFTLEPTTTNLETKTLFSVTSAATDCFGRGLSGFPHYIYFYPEEKERELNSWRPIINKDEVRSLNGSSLYFEVDFPAITWRNSGLRPYGRNKTWVLLVCAVRVNNPVHCINDTSKRVARLSFRMTPPPTPTPRPPTPVPTDLPRVQQPTQCIYQRGSEVDITIENLMPNVLHVWWWRGDRDPKGRFVPTTTTYPLHLKKEDTNFLKEKKTLCVHRAIPIGESCKEGIPNSVTFFFDINEPKGDTSCVALTPPTPTPIPLPTCVSQPGCSSRPFTQCGDVECNGETWEPELLIGVCEYTCGEEKRYECTPIVKVQQCGYFPTPTPFPCPVCPDTHPKYDKSIRRCCAQNSKGEECKSPIEPTPVGCESESQCGFGIGCGLGVRGPCSEALGSKDRICETAIGRINTNPAEFVKRLFGVLLGISGGIALLLILYSSYRLMASRGDPEKLQGARETLTSAIVGLLFIIFSLVILEIVGVDILQIPGLGR